MEGAAEQAIGGEAMGPMPDPANQGLLLAPVPDSIGPAQFELHLLAPVGHSVSIQLLQSGKPASLRRQLSLGEQDGAPTAPARLQRASSTARPQSNTQTDIDAPALPMIAVPELPGSWWLRIQLPVARPAVINLQITVGPRTHTVRFQGSSIAGRIGFVALDSPTPAAQLVQGAFAAIPGASGHGRVWRAAMAANHTGVTIPVALRHALKEAASNSDVRLAVDAIMLVGALTHLAPKGHLPVPLPVEFWNLFLHFSELTQHDALARIKADVLSRPEGEEKEVQRLMQCQSCDCCGGTGLGKAWW